MVKGRKYVVPALYKVEASVGENEKKEETFILPIRRAVFWEGGG